MTSKKNSNYFRGDLWFQEQVKSRARAELSRQQESFAEEHKDDTEEQLIAYVRGFANALGRTPNAGEVIGGPYIASRFGSWDRLVSKAGLPRPGMMPQMERRLIYKKERLRRHRQQEGRPAVAVPLLQSFLPIRSHRNCPLKKCRFRKKNPFRKNRNRCRWRRKSLLPNCRI